MNIGEAWGIFQNIDSDKYSDEEKGRAIYEVCKAPTHNSLQKKHLLQVIWWLLGLCFELPEESDGAT